MLDPLSYCNTISNTYTYFSVSSGNIQYILYVHIYPTTGISWYIITHAYIFYCIFKYIFDKQITQLIT